MPPICLPSRQRKGCNLYPIRPVFPVKSQRLQREYRMGRYFFHVVNGEFIPDPNGIECSDENEVKAGAVRIVGEILKDQGHRHLEHEALQYVRVRRQEPDAIQAFLCG
jgi:hypothetical protein